MTTTSRRLDDKYYACIHSARRNRESTPAGRFRLTSKGAKGRPAMGCRKAGALGDGETGCERLFPHVAGGIRTRWWIAGVGRRPCRNIAATPQRCRLDCR
jgi:predicted nucleic acid-binding Zn ribbon protein